MEFWSFCLFIACLAPTHHVNHCCFTTTGTTAVIIIDYSNTYITTDTNDNNNDNDNADNHGKFEGLVLPFRIIHHFGHWRWMGQ